MNFKEELQKRVETANTCIQAYLPGEKGYTKLLAEAMNYSILAGGKRLRPILMLESYRMFGGSGRAIETFMAAIEMIHTHSLIHDDLPAIDNDMYRRGKKTTHAQYGEAIGVLSGDALLNYAYEVVLHSFDLEPDNKGIVLAAQVLSAKTGMYGMLGGQSVDVMNEGAPLDEDMLMYIYQNKTSALIEASLMVGAILAGAPDRETLLMEKAGKKIGVAFQIQDDILDICSSQEELGKPIGSDEKNHKTTYVSIHGLDAAREKVQELSMEALFLLKTIPGDHDFLDQLVLELTTRKM